MSKDTGSTSLQSPSSTVLDPLLGPGGRLVVGFDGSAAGAAALAWAAVRARHFGTELQLTGVVDDDFGAMGADYSEESSLRLAQLLSEAADRLEESHPGLAISSRLVEGSVADALASAASTGDLVVIGSDKTGFARGRVYGVRSLQLAAVTTSALVVIPSVDVRLRTGVVVAVDDTAGAIRLARIGAREARQRDGQLVLVHAIPMGSDADRRARAEVVLAAARAAAEEEDASIQVTSHLAHRRPAEAVLNLSRDKALLLVGRSRRPDGLGLGGTLHEVLLNANVPVVVVR